MNELILSPIETNNQRVLLTTQLAEVYGVEERRISENFNFNKQRYQEGKHYYCLQGESLKEFKNQYGTSVSVGERTAKLYLWTEKGALLHAKSLNTDKAWDVYDQLVETYFKIQQLRPMTQTEILAAQAQLLVDIEKKQREQDKAIEKVDKCLDGICDIVKLDTTSWREESRKLITKIAKSMGGVQYIRDVQTEIYKLVELRGSVNLSIRLTNKRRRMADEGVCKSKRDKLNYLDIIAEDKKLIEIYTAITKEMAVKYGAFYESAM